MISSGGVVSRLLPLCAVFAIGCGTEYTVNDPSNPTPPPAIGAAFDASNTGSVSGRVTWKGPIPKPPGFLFCTPTADGRGLEYHEAENPNRPIVDAKSRGVAGAVVFLRDIDPAKSRAWDLPTVSVEMNGGTITVAQGERRGRVGFVRRGDSITATSTGPMHQILRGRGDAFFSIALPDANQAATRTLTAPGRVELSSATGLYWARADVFVADHPYFTVTDADGHFNFSGVPAGAATVVVWLPGWEAAQQERDPDTTAITRMQYSPPIERVKPVAVKPGQPGEADISVP